MAFAPLDWKREPASVQFEELRDFEAVMRRRRTVREFSPERIAPELL